MFNQKENATQNQANEPQGRLPRSSTDPRLQKIISQLDQHSPAKTLDQEAQIKDKILLLVEEFANGEINQQQFLDIYRHYRNEVYAHKAQIKPQNTSDNTIMIRNKHRTNTLAYAIYDSESGIPIGTRGDFPIDPALLIPMLASYHGAAKEIFGQGIRKAEVFGGRWISFIVGEITTMILLVENEPSASYMETLTKQHELFEGRNIDALQRKPIRPEEIDFPKPLFLQMMDELS